MFKKLIVYAMVVSRLLYASSENESFGIKEMEGAVKHAAFFVALPKHSVNSEHKKYKSSLIKYREEKGEITISKSALHKKEYQKDEIVDFIKELRSHLKRDKGRYEVSGYIYRKGRNGNFIGKKIE